MKNLGITGITLLFVLSCGGLDGNPFDAKSSNYTPPDALGDYAEAGTLYIVYGVDTVRVRDTVRVGSGGTVEHDTIRIKDTVRVGTMVHDTIRVRDTVKITGSPSIKESTPIIINIHYKELNEDMATIEVWYQLDKCTEFSIRFSKDGGRTYHYTYEVPARENGLVGQEIEFEKPLNGEQWYTINAQCISPEKSKISVDSDVVVPSK